MSHHPKSKGLNLWPSPEIGMTTASPCTPHELWLQKQHEHYFHLNSDHPQSAQLNCDHLKPWTILPVATKFFLSASFQITHFTQNPLASPPHQIQYFVYFLQQPLFLVVILNFVLVNWCQRTITQTNTPLPLTSSSGGWFPSQVLPDRWWWGMRMMIESLALSTHVPFSSFPLCSRTLSLPSCPLLYNTLQKYYFSDIC